MPKDTDQNGKHSADPGQNSKQGPVVQSIDSLTTLLRRQLVKVYADYICKYTIIFCWKNNSVFVIFTFKILTKNVN